MKSKQLLIGLIIIGALLRFYNLNWDEFHTFHPDERNIASAAVKTNFFENLNPEFFAYGTFLIYLIRLLAEVMAVATGDPAWLTDWGHVNLVGRAISASAATASVLLTYLLANKFFNKATATAAAALVTFSPSLIQSAHFGTTESILAFFALAVTLACTAKTSILTAVLFGSAVATKMSALSFAAPLIVSYIKDIKRLFGVLLISTAIFLFISPYAFLARDKFLESMRYESGVVTGKLKVVYVLQFENTLPYVFQFKSLLWQMGPAAALAIPGLFLLVRQFTITKDKKLLIFLSFPLLYIAYVGSWYAKFVRYLTPAIPFLAILAAVSLVEVQRKFKVTGLTLSAVLLTTSAVWALAFFSIYTKPQTRITASQWIYQNVPPGAKILGEHWDDGLPVKLGEKTHDLYNVEQLTIYEPDNKQKVEYLAEKLSEANYLILASRRLYGTLINLPQQYPVTSRYYQLLFAQELGYTKSAEFTSYPQLFGFTINDDTSEETFQVYDHPRVLIFQNTKQLDKNTLVEKIAHHE